MSVNESKLSMSRKFHLLLFPISNIFFSSFSSSLDDSDRHQHLCERSYFCLKHLMNFKSLLSSHRDLEGIGLKNTKLSESREVIKKNICVERSISVSVIQLKLYR